MESVLGAFVILVVLVSLAESVLSGLWVKIYFKGGLRLYEKRLSVTSLGLEERLEGYLENLLEQDKPLRHFRSRKLTPGLYGIREKFLDFGLFRYTPIMHGALDLDRPAMSLRLSGYLNPSLLLFCLTWYGIMAFVPLQELDGMAGALFKAVFLLAPLGTAGLIYFVQKRRYDRIWAHLEKLGKEA